MENKIMEYSFEIRSNKFNGRDYEPELCEVFTDGIDWVESDEVELPDYPMVQHIPNAVPYELVTIYAILGEHYGEEDSNGFINTELEDCVCIPYEFC